jgi:hypothetical protein
MKQRIVLSLVCLCLFPTVALAQSTQSPEGAYLYIGWPNDGEALRCNNFRVWFGLRGMGIAPAQQQKVNTGHHHLLVDVDVPPLDEEIPNDRNHLHFGGGQSETRLTLPPGEHTLQLLFADHRHIPHDPPVMSKRKTITCK